MCGKIVTYRSFIFRNSKFIHISGVSVIRQQPGFNSRICLKHTGDPSLISNAVFSEFFFADTLDGIIIIGIFKIQIKGGIDQFEEEIVRILTNVRQKT